MGFIIAVLSAVAGVFIYMRVFASGAREAADAVETLSNLPRRMRHRRAAGKRGFDLLASPLEAATAMMVAVARVGPSRAVTPPAREVILDTLTGFMEQSPSDAQDLLTQIEALLFTTAQPADGVARCTTILHPALGREDAERLAGALSDIAAASGASSDQMRLVAAFRERMDLL